MDADAESRGEAGSRSDPPLGGRYRLIERIGVGGMAVVYLAEDLRLGRKVAAKRLHADSPDHAAGRFLREAKLGAALSHPNLVTVFDAFADGEDLVIVMEYIAGPDLGEALGSGPLDDERALRVLGDVAAALDHTHAAGIIHRDVKPSNVLLASDGSARLTDLGIARVLEDTQTTQAGIVVGSTPYMSPEQLSGAAVGPPADVYALALTAYEALSGEPARSGMPAQIAYQATEAPPPDIREVRAEVPSGAAEALKRGMARRPQDRPASAGEFVDELERGLIAVVGATTVADRPAAGPSATPPPPRAPVRPRRPTTPQPSQRGRQLAIGLLVLLTLALAAVAITSVIGDDPGETSALEQSTTDDESGQGQGAGDEGPARAAAVEAGSPEAAVKDFYESAAEDDFDGAVALASPNLEDLLGGPSGIAGTFDTLVSIEFKTLRVISGSDATAEVELATVATHTDRVKDCTGSASLVADGEGWLVDGLAGISCDVR